MFAGMGRLHLDMSFQSRYVLSGIEMKCRLIRAKDSFCLHGNADQAENKVSLKEVSLYPLYGQIYGVNQSQKPGKVDNSRHNGQEISQKA